MMVVGVVVVVAAAAGLGDGGGEGGGEWRGGECAEGGVRVCAGIVGQAGRGRWRTHWRRRRLFIYIKLNMITFNITTHIM